jgi:hypothetical protein
MNYEGVGGVLSDPAIWPLYANADRVDGPFFLWTTDAEADQNKKVTEIGMLARRIAIT